MPGHNLTQERGGHMIALTKDDRAVRWCDGQFESGAESGEVTCPQCRGFVAEAFPPTCQRASEGRTIGEIIDMVQDGEKPDYDDVRLTVCALAHLRTMDGRALRNLVSAEKESKPRVLIYSAEWQYEESFKRQKRAYAQTP